jgi:hypothetical protein
MPPLRVPARREKWEASARGRRVQEATPFSSFLERDAVREGRRRRSRRTVVISIAVHVVVLGGLLAYGLWKVEELSAPSVGVRLYGPAKAPPGLRGEGGRGGASAPTLPSGAARPDVPAR